MVKMHRCRFATYAKVQAGFMPDAEITPGD